MCDSKRASQPDVKTSGFFLPAASAPAAKPGLHGAAGH
jgi:hypothetical protein